MQMIIIFIFKLIVIVAVFHPCKILGELTSIVDGNPVEAIRNKLTFIDQRLAVVYPLIQTFKKSITSDPQNITGSWVGSDICNYKGFYCDNPPDNKTATALASIDFNGFHLKAPTLDGFLDLLPDLALFHANSNFFSGTISPNIAKLPYLYEIDLSNNLFTGSFPIAILGMRTLSFLDIRFNSFTGSIPPQLFTKQDLDILFLNNNDFIQQLAEILPVDQKQERKLAEILGTSHLFYLTLANNKFFGPIPRSIATYFSSVSEVLLLNNMLSGCLPYELGFLTETVVFDVGNNLLTGPLPFSLGCMKKAEVINFAGNLLYGGVPEVLCAMDNLANLSLSDNYLTSVGPVCRGLIKKGVLDVRNNCIMGQPDQRSVAECSVFFSKPRYCSYRPTYRYLPCWVPHFSGSPPSPMAPSEPAPAPV
ncbi:putative leucine-rich repeat-containing, plant-type, leucine-rich repeat domain superfamily [Helianthus anomalus]